MKFLCRFNFSNKGQDTYYKVVVASGEKSRGRHSRYSSPAASSQQQKNYIFPSFLRNLEACTGTYQCLPLWEGPATAERSHSSHLRVVPWKGREKMGTKLQSYSNVANSEQAPGKRDKPLGPQTRHLLLPEEVLSQGAKPEPFPIQAAPNEVHRQRAALTSRVWFCKPLKAIF